MDLLECRKKRFVKEVSIDENKINSILKNSENKLKSADLLPLEGFSTNSKISLAYDCLRELLEALALKNKLKIYNHECYTAFLKEIIKDSLLGDEFDSVRIIRSSANYYGKKISIEDCKDTLIKIKDLIRKIKEEL